MKLYVLYFTAMVSVLMVCGANVYADSVKVACLKEAEADFNLALADARFERRSARAACRFSPEVASCVTDCFPAFKECLQPIFESLKSCRQDCFSTLVAAKASAREEFGCGNSCNTNADYQRAIIEANLAFNTCRINCRGQSDVVTARAGCRTAHGLCVNDCKSE